MKRVAGFLFCSSILFAGTAVSAQEDAAPETVNTHAGFPPHNPKDERHQKTSTVQCEGPDPSIVDERHYGLPYQDGKPIILTREFWDFNETLPKNFRTMQTAMKPSKDGAAPSKVGLDYLRLSASAEFSKDSLKKIQAALPPCQLCVVDLRQESHGYLNGEPVHWFWNNDDINADKNLAQIQADENARLNQLKGTGTATTYDLKLANQPGVYKVGINPQTEKVSFTEDEEQLCKELGVSYVRIPIQHDHGPTDAQVDQFVKLVTAQPADGWLHIHCTDGRGRTTTFTAMDDMMHNADKVSCEDILRRQHDIGGANLLTAQSDLDWKEQDYEERRKFIEAFYAYCQAQIPNRFTQTWSEWYAPSHG